MRGGWVYIMTNRPNGILYTGVTSDIGRRAYEHREGLVEGPALERAPRFADLLELSREEQAALDGFETLSPNGRPLGAQDFIAMVEMKLGRTHRPGKRGRKAHGVRAD